MSETEDLDKKRRVYLDEIEALRKHLDVAVDGIEKALIHIPEFSPAYNYLQEALAEIDKIGGMNEI